MKRTVFEAPEKVLVEHDPDTNTYVLNWLTYCGPHFRQAVSAFLEAIQHGGVTNYVANSSRAVDVPTQEDFQWIDSVARPAMLKAGIRRFITVVPASAVAKMGANRFGRMASQAGVDTYQVASVDEAMAIVLEGVDPKP